MRSRYQEKSVWQAAVACLIFILFVFVSQVSAQKNLPKVEPDKPDKPTPENVTKPEPDKTNPKPLTPTTGALAISSDPPGAKVYINESLLGTTDVDGTLNKQLKPGRYTIVVKYPEHKDHKEIVTIRAGLGEQVYARLTPTYAYMVLTTPNLETGAKIELDGKPLSEKDLMRDSDGKIRIKTSPGDHEIKIARAGYTAFSKRVTVTVSEPAIVDVNFEAEVGILVVKSEPNTRVYINDEPRGEISAKGEIRYSLVAGRDYRVMLDLEGYEKLEKSVPVKMGNDNIFEAKLMPLSTSSEFSDGFLDLSQWNAPIDWKVEKNTLQVRGTPGVGLPKNKRYRNCAINFVLRLSDTRGAAWVVRAKDAKNGYLFYLNGPTGPFPNQLRAYILRNGNINLNDPVAPAQPVLIPLKKDIDYEISIRVEDNKIYHSYTPSDTGEQIQIGVFEDAEKSFTIGNVGFALINGEDFKVGTFIILPLSDNVTADAR
jgi:hypothetical protein